MAADQADQSDSPASEEALAAVYDTSESGTKDISWSDVSGDISSEQWHALIERDVLVSAGDGFVLSNPRDVQARIDGESSGDHRRVELDGWQRTDRVVGVVVLALFAGYFFRPLRQVIASTEGLVFGLLVDLLPFYWVVLVLAVLTSLGLCLSEARLLDHEAVDQYKQQLERLKTRREAAKQREDEEALEQIDQVYPGRIRGQVRLLTSQFRPTVWSMLLTIPVFLWLRWMVVGGRLSPDAGLVLPFAGSVTWQEPVLGPIQAWLVWYFLASAASQQLIEKSLGIGSS